MKFPEDCPECENFEKFRTNCKTCDGTGIKPEAPVCEFCGEELEEDQKTFCSEYCKDGYLNENY